jgi:hypothetical protein
MKKSGNSISLAILGATLLSVIQAPTAHAVTFSASRPVPSAQPYTDSPNSLFIDRDGTFFLQNAYAQYDDVPGDHVWSFYTGSDADSVTFSAENSQYDTRKLCNDRNPVAFDLFGWPVKSRTGYSQADYCDMMGVWVDPDSGNWYGLVHNELYGNDPRLNAISFAVSTDKGANWSMREPILTSPYGKGDPGTPYYYYGDGDPRLFVDSASGYFYVYYMSKVIGQNGNRPGYNNYMWAHVARAPISQKMAPASWEKFYNGKWQQVRGTNWTCDASIEHCATAPVSSSLESNIPGPDTDLTAQGGPAADHTGSETFVPPPLGSGSLLDAGYSNGTLRVTNISWNVYLQKFIAVAEDRTIVNPGTPDFDYSGQATTLKFYETDNLDTQHWTYAGSVPYYSASWYRWFLDSATKTSSSALGQTFRAYCAFGCSTYGSEYLEVTAKIDSTADQAPVYYADSKGNPITAGSNEGQYFISHPGNPATNLPAAASGTWTIKSTGDGFFTIAINKTYLGVADGVAGRAWGAPVALSSTASKVQQQWYFQAIPATADAAPDSAGYRIVNRYSGLTLSFAGSVLTSDLTQAVTAPIRNWDAASRSSIAVWSKGDQAVVLQQPL